MQDAVMPRRSFLKKLIGGVLGLTAVVFSVPALKYLMPEVKSGGENILTNADGKPIPESEIKEGSSFIGLSGFGPTIVIRRDGKLRALSAVCTHLGCLVKWVPTEDIFFCPCHSGKFDVNGVNISGPPPSPLAMYNAEINKEGYVTLNKI